ncbi:C-terminal processing protease CtpA/Prc, contains a PDZ domain [Duganella sacchari]|uniref:C-terminal processing protease CtpA/Prc, contains a PDZ domain n=2 Tax=Duganella sacchari TaxID=551987 RepID=A0A1M7P6V8_9BURK|nr:C-terminal processing protease CtpA/Prc, contains a PDZ domain [Duganella sacchari]
MALAAHCAAASISDSVEHVRALRAQADKFTNAGATTADLQHAASLLEAAQRYLAGDEMASASQALQLEAYNNLLPLSAVYSRQGRKEQALAALGKASMLLWYPGVAQMLRNQSQFDAIRKEPRFQAMLDASLTPDRVWKGLASDHPYKEALTVEERIAGLTQFWTEARHGFVYFDKVPELDWGQVYLDYLPKVIAARTTRDYYAVMRQLAPLLKDGHSNIWAPAELADEFYAVPPVRMALVEGRVLVAFVDDAILRTRVQVGDELLAIDGMPVHDYARQRVSPLISAGAPQDRDFQIYTVDLLRGRAADAVVLRLRAANGVQREEQIDRNGSYHAPEAPEFKMLDKGIAYLRIEHFSDNSGLKAFEAALPQIMKARGLIIDMRRNGGGDGQIGYEILSYLTRQRIKGAVSHIRSDDTYNRARGGNMMNWTQLANGGYMQQHDHVYEGPVAVLTGPQTYSASEDFVVAFNVLQRGLTLGESTGGSTGQPLNFTLPGGGGARICIKRDLFPDGREFVGIGVPPQIEVKQTVAGLRAGRDPVLERALAELRQRSTVD